MVKRLLILTAILGLAGCESTPVTTKVVAAKASPVEGETTFVNVGNKVGFTETGETNYYLVAEDGTVVRVGMTKWYATKIGEKHTGKWYEKR